MTRAAVALLVVASASVGAQVSQQWPQHSMDRPRPPVVKPGAFESAPPPSDAIVLFDGKSLAKWQSSDSTHGAAKWKVADGYMEIAPGTGGIETRDAFGDCQLHVEWRAPTPAKGEGQERGNSGVFLMGTYEVQVLDSYNNITYADGQAAAVYGQYPPLVNASRPPGEWQSYDIVWHRPHFDAQGRLASAARITVFFNGLLAQDNVILTGPTAHQHRPPYHAHPDALPLGLQDHGNPVRYRNIWIRNLEPVSGK
jgi:hypothetical protein